MKIGRRTLGYVNQNVSYSAGYGAGLVFSQIGVEVNCDQTDAPTEALRLGSISRPVRLCQPNHIISTRNVTHSGRSNAQYLHAVGTCTGN